MVVGVEVCGLLVGVADTGEFDGVRIGLDEGCSMGALEGLAVGSLNSGDKDGMCVGKPEG